MSDLRARPRYRLSYYVNGKQYPIYFEFVNKVEIKKFLREINLIYSTYNTKCTLEDVRIRIAGGSITSTSYDITSELENIYSIEYGVSIASTGSVGYLRFNTLAELKDFFRHYGSSGGEWTYTFRKTTRYFDKDNNYVLSAKYETITDLGN